MFKWVSPRFSGVRHTTPAKKSAAKGPHFGNDGEPYLEGKKLLFGYSLSDEVEAGMVPLALMPPPGTFSPVMAPEEVEPDEGELRRRSVQARMDAAGYSVLPRVPSDGAAGLMAITAGLGIAPIAAAAAAAAQLSFAAIGISAVLAGGGTAAAVCSQAPEPYTAYKNRLSTTPAAELLPYVCCLGGESIRRRALRLRVLTRTAHTLELLMGVAALGLAIDLYMAVPFGFSRYYPFITVGDPSYGAQASPLAASYELLIALVCLGSFRRWLSTAPYDRLRQMWTGEAYGRLADAPMTYEEFLAKNQPKLGLEEKPCLARVGEAFEEAFEELSDILLRRVFGSKTVEELSVYLGRLHMCFGRCLGATGRWQPIPPELATSRDPLWNTPSFVSDLWFEFGVNVRAQPLKCLVALACFTLAADAVLVYRHVVPPHSIEISHELFGSVIISGGSPLQGVDMNRLWLSTYGLFFTSFLVLLSTHRAFRKIVRPLEFEDCERAESERIEERTAKRTARQHRTHMSWLLAASYESPDECRHLVGEIDEAIKQATAFRSTLPFPNEPPKLTYYDEDPEFGWKLLPPPAEDLAAYLPIELTRPLSPPGRQPDFGSPPPSPPPSPPSVMKTHTKTKFSRPTSLVLRPSWCLAFDKAIQAAVEGFKAICAQLKTLERVEAIANMEEPNVDELQSTLRFAASILVPAHALELATRPRGAPDSNLVTFVAEPPDMAPSVLETVGSSMGSAIAGAGSWVSGLGSAIGESMGKGIGEYVESRRREEAARERILTETAKGLLEVSVAGLRQALADAEGVLSASELLGHREKCDQAEKAQATLKAAMELVEGHVLLIDPAAIRAAVAACKDAGIDERALAFLVAFAADAAEAQTNDPVMRALKACTAPPDLMQIDVSELRHALGEAKAAGIPDALIARFEATLLEAEQLQVASSGPDTNAAATKVQAAMRGKSVRSAREKKAPAALPAAPAAAAAARSKPAVTGQRFAIGCDVYVKRSNGEESIAFVQEYDAAKKAYLVELEPAGSGIIKQCREEIMREGPSAAA
jgi:hypothetical protein